MFTVTCWSHWWFNAMKERFPIEDSGVKKMKLILTYKYRETIFKLVPHEEFQNQCDTNFIAGKSYCIWWDWYLLTIGHKSYQNRTNTWITQLDPNRDEPELKVFNWPKSRDVEGTSGMGGKRTRIDQQSEGNLRSNNHGCTVTFMSITLQELFIHAFLY